jgi:1-acyl-sn-glycerol-3-phosphate acyltransferase
MAAKPANVPFGAGSIHKLLSVIWGLLATILSLIYTIILGPIAALLAALGREHLVSALSRQWSRLILRTCGIKVELEGLENLTGLRSFVLVTNHQSLIDILAIIAYVPGEARFVAKKELLRIPFIGYTIRRARHIVIDRRAGGRTIRRALETARRGYFICTFAEGHRFADNSVHKFNEGAAWIAIATKLVCVPAAIIGSGAVLPPGALLVSPGARMVIRLGKPIETANLANPDRTQLTARLEDAVRAEFRPAP